MMEIIDVTDEPSLHVMIAEIEEDIKFVRELLVKGEISNEEAEARLDALTERSLFALAALVILSLKKPEPEKKVDVKDPTHTPSPAA